MDQEEQVPLYSRLPAEHKYESHPLLEMYHLAQDVDRLEKSQQRKIMNYLKKKIFTNKIIMVYVYLLEK